MQMYFLASSVPVCKLVKTSNEGGTLRLPGMVIGIDCNSGWVAPAGSAEARTESSKVSTKSSSGEKAASTLAHGPPDAPPTYKRSKLSPAFPGRLAPYKPGRGNIGEVSGD